MPEREPRFGDIVSLDPASAARSWRFMLIAPVHRSDGDIEWQAWPLVYLTPERFAADIVYLHGDPIYLIEAAP